MKLFTIALGLVLTGAAFPQKPDTPASPTGKTASDGQTNAQGAAKTGGASELKTQTYKGTLVDATCTGGGPSASSTGPSSADREKSSNPAAASSTKGESAKGSANRSANAGSNCSISPSTSAFALQMKDGHTIRFDAVGNERAKQELANRKNWTNASAAGKPIQATVNGTETGDSLLVVSIH